MEITQNEKICDVCGDGIIEIYNDFFDSVYYVCSKCGNIIPLNY